jgi:hypothetical protein
MNQLLSRLLSKVSVLGTRMKLNFKQIAPERLQRQIYELVKNSRYRGMDTPSGDENSGKKIMFNTHK